MQPAGRLFGAACLQLPSRAVPIRRKGALPSASGGGVTRHPSTPGGRGRREGTDGTLHRFFVSLFSPAGSPGCPMFIARSEGFFVVCPGQAGAGGLLSAESGSVAYAAQATG